MQCAVCSILLALGIFVIPGSLHGQTIEFKLDDLSEFGSVDAGWQIKSDVYTNPLVKNDQFHIRSGKGIIVGSSTNANKGSKLISRDDYGDIELQFEMMMGHDGLAEIYLQGRYGIILADSWGREKLTRRDNASLIEPETPNYSDNIYPNTARVNVSSAPGVWQRFRIVFKAPGFDAEGNKIKPAKFERIVHNGTVVHENKYVSKPYRGALFEDEAAKGPLMVRIKSGNIALRNIKINKLAGETVKLNNMSYELFNKTFFEREWLLWGGDPGSTVELPDLDAIAADEQGKTEYLTGDLGSGGQYALRFTGTLEIPEDGPYTFSVPPQNFQSIYEPADSPSMGSLLIDGEQLFAWNGLHHKGSTQKTVDLSKGEHSFTFNHFNIQSRWSDLEIFVEGPSIQKQALHLQKEEDHASNEMIPLLANHSPVIQRSYLKTGPEEITTTGLSVGYPSQINYSVDMATGTLLQAWKGDFADAVNMWEGRGIPQTLVSLGEPVFHVDTPQVLVSSDRSKPVDITAVEKDQYQRQGYSLSADGSPILNYSVGHFAIRDQIKPDQTNRFLTRRLEFQSKQIANSDSYWYLLMKGKDINRTPDGLYVINNKEFYIDITSEGVDKTEILQQEEHELLLVPIDNAAKKKSELRYSIIW
ncbi:family 16 glycoside hydrolase [Halalkalibaculum sp. DA384]|uniref:family 16 glycoside hydrolase n=1 Tax=Halalkalibaculum sp. DA384 TaxID=3373606 RepID=UPI00375495B8